MELQRLWMPEIQEEMWTCVCVYVCASALGLMEEVAENSQETRQDGY